MKKIIKLKTNFKNFIKNFRKSNSVFSKNIKRWKKLPGGRERYNLETLNKKSDQECLEKYLHFSKFWEEERGWEYEKYKKKFTGKNVIEVGAGFGFDAYTYAQVANSYTCIDINPIQIEFIKRIHKLLSQSEEVISSNIFYQLLEDPFNHNYGEKKFNAFYSHGVFHHMPFEDAKKQFKNINRFLEKGSYIVFLMYPKERWEDAGKPSFKDFGKSTDGGCPWTEWYDKEKIIDLVGKEFKLIEVIPWAFQSTENGDDIPAFINFELEKI